MAELTGSVMRFSAAVYGSNKYSVDFWGEFFVFWHLLHEYDWCPLIRWISCTMHGLWIL